jgi:rare lipoprotein A
LSPTRRLQNMMIRLDSWRFPYFLRVITAPAVFSLFALFVYGCTGTTGYKPSPDWIGYQETGMASYYAMNMQHRKTASGEPLNNQSMTAAHKTLPFGTQVLVKNLANGKSVRVRINDRGPFVEGRIIDLTRTAFSRIASLDRGLAKVEVKVVK